MPLVGNGLVIVRTADTRVTAFDASSGEQRWRYQRQAPSLTIKNASGMIFFGPMILVGQSNGYLLGLSAEGRPVWQALISEARGITEVERLVDILGTPMVNRDLLCASAFQGRLVCMDATNGQLRFTHDVTAMTPPAADDRFVYIGNTASELYAFDRTRGYPVWKILSAAPAWMEPLSLLLKVMSRELFSKLKKVKWPSLRCNKPCFL